MVRPDLQDIQAGVAGWDGLINEIIEALHRRPFPIAQIADTATLNATFDPADYEECLIMVSDTRDLYTSDGATWSLL